MSPPNQKPRKKSRRGDAAPTGKVERERPVEPVRREPVTGPYNPRVKYISLKTKKKLVKAMCRQPNGLCVLPNIISETLLKRIQEIAPFEKCIKDFGGSLFGKDPNDRDDAETSKRELAALSWWIIKPGIHEHNDYDRFVSKVWANEVVEYVSKILIKLGLIHPRYHICDGLALLRALEDCPMQHPHADFDSWDTRDPLFDLVKPYEDCTPFPISVLIATSPDGAKLWTPEGEVHFDQYSCVVFRGDLIHAGCSYDKENWRIHIYFGYKRPTDEGNTLQRRVPTRAEKNGKRYTSVITKGNNENNSFFDVLMGRAEYERAYPGMNTH